MKKLIFSLALLFATQAQATTNWSGYHGINKIYPAANGFYFHMDANGNLLPNTTGCDNRMLLNKTISNYDALVDAVMLAFTLEKQVRVHYERFATDCNAEVDRLDVLQ